jgi:hypothetical protein
MPEWIADCEHLQEMPLELSAHIDAFLEAQPSNKDVEDIRDFLADRHAALQAHIDKLRSASLSGSKVILTEEED